MASVLVLTGIDGAKQLLAASESRPDFILDDLRQLFEPYPVREVTTKDGRRQPGGFGPTCG